MLSVAIIVRKQVPHLRKSLDCNQLGETYRVCQSSFNLLVAGDLKEALKCFIQHSAGFFSRTAATGYIQLRADGDELIAFANNPCCQIENASHALIITCQQCATNPSWLERTSATPCFPAPMSSVYT